MSAVEQAFLFGAEEVRVVAIDREPWFVLADLCRVLGLSNPRMVAQRIGDDVSQTYPISDALGRQQHTTIVSEAGMYEVVIRSDKPEAIAFRRWITGTVLPEIRRTGSYGAPAPVAELDRRQLALMVIEAEDAREAAEQRAAIEAQRADVAEEFREQIELNDGLTVRDFHKKYFSEHGEREVNEFFYSRDLLIDERNKRYNPETGQRKDGKNHRRPTFRGKAFFYLHGELDHEGIRREKVRVRPGAPEIALVNYMTNRGFTANRSESRELAHV